MNVERSTFAQRGYLLTALAVAVLLAGFAGTVWAQTTPTVPVTLTMRASSSTLEEGADMEPSTPGRVTVTITWSGTYDGDGTAPREDVFVSGDTSHFKLTATCNGLPSQANDDCSFSVQVKGGSELNGLGTLAGSPVSFNDDTSDPNDDKVEKTIELLILRRPQFSWTRIKGESDVKAGRVNDFETT